MLTYLRYALATVCFALSVGCLALWWRSMSYRERAHAPMFGSARLLHIDLRGGVAKIEFPDTDNPFFGPPDGARWGRESGVLIDSNDTPTRKFPLGFGRTHDEIGVYFPLWYASLVLALAGVTSLRLGRRFTLRSAIVATTVVAGLLGMAVIL